MKSVMTAATAAAMTIAAALAPQLARADVIFTLGNHPQANEENILFGAAESGLAINGATNQSNVDFTFSTLTGQTLFQKAKGQALIQSNNGPVSQSALTSIDVRPASGFGYQDFIMNPLNGSPGTIATVTAVDNAGQSFTYDLGNGQNYLTITTANKEFIVELAVTLNAGGTFEQFKQPRVSGLCLIPSPGATPTIGQCGGGGGGGGSVPEPMGLSLLGVGLVGLGLVKWGRRAV